MLDLRTEADLKRAVRSLARHFKTDSVIIIGSQSVLVGWPDAPTAMRLSEEIDAYPGNAKEWEATNPGFEASEEIHALFGIGSAFHDAYGFYIDGVDEDTAKLPPGWEDRATIATVEDGPHRIHAIAPCLEDLVVSKLHRLSDKDRDYIEVCHKARPLDLAVVRERLVASKPHPALLEAADRYLVDLATPAGAATNAPSAPAATTPRRFRP